MCRNIRPLFNFEPPATDEEIRAAALQYVRKVSGTRQPSGKNVECFERAVEEITRATRVVCAPQEPRDRSREGARSQPETLRLIEPAASGVRT
jgi:hypothetical protein